MTAGERVIFLWSVTKGRIPKPLWVTTHTCTQEQFQLDSLSHRRKESGEMKLREDLLWWKEH